MLKRKPRITRIYTLCVVGTKKKIREDSLNSWLKIKGFSEGFIRSRRPWFPPQWSAQQWPLVSFGKAENPHSQNPWSFKTIVPRLHRRTEFYPQKGRSNKNFLGFSVERFSICNDDSPKGAEWLRLSNGKFAFRWWVWGRQQGAHRSPSSLQIHFSSSYRDSIQYPPFFIF